MNLKNLYTENKPVQTKVLFEPTESKVISLQIEANVKHWVDAKEDSNFILIK